MRGRGAKQWVIAAMGLAIALGIWQIATVRAEAAGAQQAPPTAVAVIDVGKVLDQLEEKRTRLADLEAFGQQLENRVADIDAERQKVLDDLDVLPKGTPQYYAKQDEAIHKQMELQSEKEFAQFRFNERKQRTKLELFNKILSAAGIYAQREGYDLVINDDRDLTIPDAQLGKMNDQSFQAFVMSRRVIYATDAVDITDEVAQHMNNNYKAAQ